MSILSWPLPSSFGREPAADNTWDSILHFFCEQRLVTQLNILKINLFKLLLFKLLIADNIESF